jgi:hypothetical protein
MCCGTHTWLEDTNDFYVRCVYRRLSKRSLMRGAIDSGNGEMNRISYVAQNQDRKLNE